MRIITWKCDVQWLDVYSRTECETARDLRMIPFLYVTIQAKMAVHRAHVKDDSDWVKQLTILVSNLEVDLKSLITAT